MFIPDRPDMGSIIPFVKASTLIILPRMIVSAKDATRKLILIIFYTVRKTP
jgi:hypothetical protein